MKMIGNWPVFKSKEAAEKESRKLALKKWAEFYKTKPKIIVTQRTKFNCSCGETEGAVTVVTSRAMFYKIISAYSGICEICGED